MVNQNAPASDEAIWTNNMEMDAICCKTLQPVYGHVMQHYQALMRRLQQETRSTGRDLYAIWSVFSESNLHGVQCFYHHENSPEDARVPLKRRNLMEKFIDKPRTVKPEPAPDP